jgi:hypothetical protein
VAQSLEWAGLGEYIFQFGVDRIVAGDYKAYDKTMPPAFIMGAFKILRRMCEKSGNFSEKDLKVLDGITIDTAFPLVEFNGDLIQFFGSNPSGHPLTVIINSLVNSLYMRYAYIILNPEQESASFRKNVALLTYGDDNILTVSRNIDWYNHTTITQAFADIGLVYTMPDKEAESVPFLSLNQASFLKRSWVYDKDVGAYLAPLEHESIEKMLMVWVKSKSIVEEEQIISVVTSAVREYFFYGRDVYEEKRKLLSDMIIALNLDAWVKDSTFPTWETLCEDFFSNSENALITYENDFLNGNPEN